MTGTGAIMNSTSLTEISREFLALRQVVAILGEISPQPWWRTTFMEDTGSSFLQRIYPTSARNAALKATGYAAAIVHDKAIGKHGAYHLFRLPPAIENAIKNGQVATTSIRTPEPEDSLKLLCTIAQDERTAAAGPIRIGVVADASTGRIVRKTASVYLSAFEGQTTAFPFFDNP
jgi:hypothetical protein